MAILTFVMFTVWAFIKSFKNRPPGDYHTEVCDNRLKDKEYDKALKAANTALEKTPNHRGAVMCRALIFISKKEYLKATEELDYLISFLEINPAVIVFALFNNTFLEDKAILLELLIVLQR